MTLPTPATPKPPIPPHQPTLLTNLPPELLLSIIPLIPYTPQTLTSLNLTNQNLHSLIFHHERHLVKQIQKFNYTPQTLALFPDLPNTYRGLRNLHARLQTLDKIHEHFLDYIVDYFELQWLQQRWQKLHKIGVLLSYRLQDVGHDHESKTRLLQTLPAMSLACILFASVAEIKILKVRAPALVHGSFAEGDGEVRKEIEEACEEVLLGEGPQFFVDMLETKENARRVEAARTLEAEMSIMRECQEMCANEVGKRPTLVSTLKAALAGRLGCDASQVVARMWEMLSSTDFDDLDDQTVVKLVKGEEVGKKAGMKRIFRIGPDGQILP